MHFFCKNCSALNFLTSDLKSILGNTDFLLTRDPLQKSVIFKKLSLMKIATNLKCLSKFFSEKNSLKQVYFDF